MAKNKSKKNNTSDKQIKIEDVMIKPDSKTDSVKAETKPTVEIVENKTTNTEKNTNKDSKKVATKSKKEKNIEERVEPEKELVAEAINSNVENVKTEDSVQNKKIKSKLTRKKTASIDDDSQPSKKKKGNDKESKKNDVQEKRPMRVKRVRTTHTFGLTQTQVNERIEKGQTNATPNNNVKTYKSIFFENIFTFFNLLVTAITISLICVDAWANCMSFLIMATNTIIGIIQEIRAKKTIEKLSLLTAPSVKVVREGIEQTITVSEVVIDDVIILSTGKQIVADATLIEGSIEVNESMLTGESLPIKKKVGDTILAGSFVVSGTCYARVEKVGVNTYLQQLSSKAKKYKRPKSELFNSLQLIIKVIGIIMIPIAILMYVNNFFRYDQDITKTITKTAGAIIGMIPSGMFLLCSVALTVSVIKLARRKALVQDLYCVEMLARVNVLCLDKTGTITDGTMKVYNCLQLSNTQYTLKRVMGSMLSALGDNNQTSQALINYFGYNKELKPVSIVPFSSSRKLSAVTFEDSGTYIMGAPEFVMPNGLDEKTENLIEQYAKDGYRVLLLAHSNANIIKDNPPSNRTAVALLILEDRIRDDAAQTISWFKKNGVKVKIISGDNPLTVAEIAKRVGVDNTEALINLEGMNEKQVIAAASKYTVFGRVTPEQKAILVKALKAVGNTVAMTGDGVNDILALKEADCSIAMASGNEAVRSVSHMVLMNSDFSSMPETVVEGRRVINNVQKASSLFFMKTIFSVVFSVLVLMFGLPYPLEPVQLMMLEMFIIGIPSFFLAFLPNDKPIEGKFIYNLFKNALPGAITLIVNVIAVYLFTYFTQGGALTGSGLDEVISSMISIVVTFTGIALLFRLCKPINALTGTVYGAMLTLVLICCIFLPEFFLLVNIGITNVLWVIILSILAPTLINTFFKLFSKVKL